MMHYNDYKIRKGNLVRVGITALYNEVVSHLEKDAPLFKEGELDTLIPGPNVKTAYVHFKSDSWYILDFVDWDAYQIFPDISDAFEQKRTPALIDAIAAWLVIVTTISPATPEGNTRLADLMLKHMHAIDWADGLPVKVFPDCICPGIEYASGRSWNYKLDSMTWF